MLHILTSPVAKPFPGTHANSVLLVSTLDLRILPLSVGLGYIIPSYLMALPVTETVSPVLHQYLIAIWQAFPNWTVIIHWSIRKISSSIAAQFASKDLKATSPPLGAVYLSNVKIVYRFILGLCILTHVPVLLITLLPSSLFKEVSPRLAHFSEHNFAETYVPYFPSIAHKVSTLVEGVLTFLEWDIYIGSAACLFWAILLHRNATTEKTIVDPNSGLPKYRELLLGAKAEDRLLWRKLILRIGIWGILAGPVGAVTALLWERDTIVRQKIKQGV